LTRARSITLVASILTLLLATPTPSEAACFTGRTNTFGNWQVDRKYLSSSTVHGIKSQLSTYSPYVVDDFSYAWVMLTRGANWTWAQIGNYSVQGYVRHLSIQYAFGSPPAYQIDLPAEAVGSLHTDEVTYTEPNAFRFLTDGSADYSDIHMTWTPTVAFISGEITNYANQMMGDSSTHQHFFNNKIKLAGSYVDFNGTLDSYLTAHFGESGSGPNFDIWDLCQ